MKDDSSPSQSQSATYTPNRRKFPRKSFRKSMSFLFSGKGEVVEGVEIGEGGISFRSARDLPMDQKVIVSFFLPEGDFFSVTTTLRNVQVLDTGNIYGLSFDEISIALKRQVRAYVARTAQSIPMYK